MRKKVVVVLTGVFLVLAGFTIGCAGEEKVDTTEVKKLFESRCSGCHSVDRAKSKNKTKAGWTTTVMRMKNVNRCPISDEEAVMIIDYLSKEYGK